ncbi:unnamed protein product [Calicophoron daubneyi]|uniref:Ig-like domain-containing protein n=1 Tax=Calicophoron daubneyi TaxID=300641 RepID=A0AAV2TN92_CALDB
MLFEPMWKQLSDHLFRMSYGRVIEKKVIGVFVLAILLLNLINCAVFQVGDRMRYSAKRNSLQTNNEGSSSVMPEEKSLQKQPVTGVPSEDWDTDAIVESKTPEKSIETSASEDDEKGEGNLEPLSIKTTLSNQDQAQRPDQLAKDELVRDSSSPVRFVKYVKGDVIKLKCRIPTGPYLVMWNKIGMDYPLSMGTERFVPDERVNVRFKPPDRWRLTINDAKLTDSGVYTCTTSSDNRSGNPSDKVDAGKGDKLREGSSPANIQSAASLPERHVMASKTGSSSARRAQRYKNNRFVNYDYYVTVVEADPNEQYQVDAPAVETVKKRNKTITVTGPKLVFYGTPLELICRATFPTAEAKMNPRIALEWYHRGIRRRENSARSGGVYISERWIDSHLLESRLLVAWASEADAGQWICLDRSNVPPRRPLAPQNHKRGPEVAAATRMRTQSEEHYLSSKHLMSSEKQTPKDLAYDRIDVEIIDLPDPTAQPDDTTPSPSIPALVLPHVASANEQNMKIDAARGRNMSPDPNYAKFTWKRHSDGGATHMSGTAFSLLFCILFLQFRHSLLEFLPDS